MKSEMLFGGNHCTDRQKGDRFAKSTCFVEGQFGERIGMEIVENDGWAVSFKIRSEVLAKRILLVKDAPGKSIEWAKRILNQ